MVTFRSNLSNLERNPKKTKNPKKIQIRKINKTSKTFFCYPLSFEYKEDLIQPELSSPARFRFQEGTLSVTDGGRRRTMEILVSNIGLLAMYIAY